MYFERQDLWNDIKKYSKFDEYHLFGYETKGL